MWDCAINSHYNKEHVPAHDFGMPTAPKQDVPSVVDSWIMLVVFVIVVELCPGGANPFTQIPQVHPNVSNSVHQRILYLPCFGKAWQSLCFVVYFKPGEHEL